MSIEKIQRAHGTVWRVRWREGNKNRSRVVGRKADAVAFDAEIRRRKRVGELETFQHHMMTLDEFAKEWMEVYAKPTLALNTLRSYAILWDLHISPGIGSRQLREINVVLCQRFAAELAASAAGQATQRKSLALLSSVLQRAVEWGYIKSNPVRLIRKPSALRQRTIHPLSPDDIEHIRFSLLCRGDYRDATIISVLAYAGLRPGELLALRWSDVQDQTLLIEHAVAHGEIKTTKTGRKRMVRLLTPVKTDLVAWKAFSQGELSSQFVFPASSGGVWNDHDWRNWRKRRYLPALKAANLPLTRPYDLRHSAASLWIHEGKSIVQVANWLGHSPQICLSTYAHVISDLVDENFSAQQLIAKARSRYDVPVSYLKDTKPNKGDSQIP